MILHGVQQKEMEQVFPLTTEWLVKIPRLLDRYTLAHVYQELDGGYWQIWLMMDNTIHGVLLSKIIQYPVCREFHLIGIAGEKMREWLPLRPVLERYARENGCVRIILQNARKGFARVLPDYSGNRVIMEKTL